MLAPVGSGALSARLPLNLGESCWQLAAALVSSTSANVIRLPLMNCDLTPSILTTALCWVALTVDSGSLDD